MSELNIYQKLAQIRKPVQVLQKNKAGYSYKYVTEDVILAKITGLMDKLGVSLIPKIVPATAKAEPYMYEKTKVTKNGEVYNEKVNEVIVTCDMEWVWVNNDNPSETITVPWFSVGQQSDASQAFGSGLSYSSRYFLLKYFNVATTESDPDNWRSEQKEAQEFEAREAARMIVEQIHGIVVAYVGTHPNEKETIGSVIKKYARTKSGNPSGNYYDITDPVIAAQLLEEIKKKCADDTKPAKSGTKKTTKEDKEE